MEPYRRRSLKNGSLHALAGMKEAPGEKGRETAKVPLGRVPVMAKARHGQGRATVRDRLGVVPATQVS